MTVWRKRHGSGLVASKGAFRLGVLQYLVTYTNAVVVVDAVVDAVVHVHVHVDPVKDALVEIDGVRRAKLR